MFFPVTAMVKEEPPHSLRIPSQEFSTQKQTEEMNTISQSHL